MLRRSGVMARLEWMVPLADAARPLISERSSSRINLRKADRLALRNVLSGSVDLLRSRLPPSPSVLQVP